MGIYHKLYPYLRNPHKLCERSALKTLLKKKDSMDKIEFIKAKFKIDLGYELDLDNPKTFNEKMQWLKFFNQRKDLNIMADKHLVKRYVSDIIGQEHIATEYGAWNKFDEVDFTKLPKSFVLKTNHGCGSMFVCKDKTKFTDFSFLKADFTKSLESNYYDNYFEYPYRDIKPMIIAEEFLSDGVNKVLPVFKFFCFGGKPFVAQIIQNDKQDNETIDYIDMDYNFLRISQGYPNSKKSKRLPKPKLFEQMKDFASKLSQGFPFLRVDLYDCGDKIIFSEFTFFSDAGFARFFPKKWDYILGQKIELPNYKIIENQKYER